MSSAIGFNLDQSKILSSGNGFKNKTVLYKGLKYGCLTLQQIIQCIYEPKEGNSIKGKEKMTAGMKQFFFPFLVAFVEDHATMSLTEYFENHVS